MLVAPANEAATGCPIGLNLEWLSIKNSTKVGEATFHCEDSSLENGLDIKASEEEKVPQPHYHTMHSIGEHHSDIPIGFVYKGGTSDFFAGEDFLCTTAHLSSVGAL